MNFVDFGRFFTYFYPFYPNPKTPTPNPNPKSREKGRIKEK